MISCLNLWKIAIKIRQINTELIFITEHFFKSGKCSQVFKVKDF